MINSARKTARGLLLDNCKILLVRRTSSRARDLTGKTEWLSVPGGGVEKSERPNQTVLREMKEELGLDVKVGNLFLTQYVPQDESL
ncbi:MAG: NUDIX domain-containing protein, partial [Pseudonocardiaceae bacterium]